MVDPMTIPSSLREAIVREMGPDEQMRWFGQPRPTTFLLGSLGLVLFGIPWTAFALFWTAGAAGFEVPDLENPGWELLFPLWGLPFIAVGLGMLSSPVWAIRRALRTAYLVTNKRAIIMEGGRSRTVRSIGPESFGNILRREHSTGRGDIVFSGAAETLVQDPAVKERISRVDPANAAEATRKAARLLSVLQAAQRSSGKSGKGGQIAFIDVENPKQVEDLLRSLVRDERW
jgi:hypothetical protein